jgi:hypothetical protein
VFFLGFPKASLGVTAATRTRSYSFREIN